MSQMIVARMTYAARAVTAAAVSEGGGARAGARHREPVEHERTGRPQGRGHETVRVGHVIQVEGIRGRDPRDDAHLLDAEEHEGGPGDVEELNGDEENPQGDGLVPPS